MRKEIATVAVASLSGKDIRRSIFIMAMLFFIFGLISWVNAILIPYFKIACELSNFQSYLVAFAFYISYFIMSVPASYLLKFAGFKKSIMIGLCTMALGAFIFVPAAFMRAYVIFLAGLFSIGVGLAVLQTTANLYISVLGHKETTAQRMSIMGLFNKGAGILAPLLFAAVIFRSTDTDLFRQLPFMDEAAKNFALDELIRRVIIPYACIGTFLFILGLLIGNSRLPEVNTGEDADEANPLAGKTNIFRFPHLILGAVAIFIHVGTQVIAIDTIISYAGSMNIHLPESKVFPTYTLFATMCGYLIGIIVIPKFIRQSNALRVCTLTGLTFTLLIQFAKYPVNFFGHSTDISIWFLALLGLPNSLIWTGIWPLALDGLGKFTKLGASVLIMGLCGNAILPLLYGYLADVFDVRKAYWILFPCYLYLVFFAFYGYRVKGWTSRKKYDH